PNLFLHEGEIALAERLLALLAADGRVFFTNSGTEANEAALKLVRRHQGPSRPVIVAADGGFHGRTMGSLALTGKESIRQPFGPFGVEVRFVAYGDADALAAAVGPDCAAVFIEPCQGEAGVVPAPAGYLSAARRACDAAGALLVVDEIQSGIRLAPPLILSAGQAGEFLAALPALLDQAAEATSGGARPEPARSEAGRATGTTLTMTPPAQEP